MRTGDEALSDPRPVRFARLRLGRMPAAGGHQGKVWLWEPGTDRAATFRAHRLYLYAVPFSPGGRTLATACFDKTVKLWNVATQQELATPRRSDHGRGAAFSPDGNTLATLSADGVLKRWRAPPFAQTDPHDGARRRPSR